MILTTLLIRLMPNKQKDDTIIWTILWLMFSNWAYRQALIRIEQLCEENRVLNPKIYPYATSQVCNHCKIRDKRSRRNERYEKSYSRAGSNA